MNKMNDYEAMLHINLCLAFGDRGWVIGDTDTDQKFIATKEEFEAVNENQDHSLHVSPLNLAAAMGKAYHKYYDGPFANELKNHSGAFPLIVLSDTIGFWTTVHEARHKEVGYYLNRKNYRFGRNPGDNWWAHEANWLWDFEQNPTNKSLHKHLEPLKPVYAGQSIWLTATRQLWVLAEGRWLKVDSDILTRCPQMLPHAVSQEIGVIRDIAAASGEESLL